MFDSDTGQLLYTGRTKDFVRRETEHHADSRLQGLEFRRLYGTDSYVEQRGLEHFIYQMYQPPLNRIRPISPSNPNLSTYGQAASWYLQRAWSGLP